MFMPFLPRITLVTPNLNQGRYLEQTLLSVLSQGYPNLEYIVVDGGSTDDSLKILERYRPHLARLIIEPDRGHADALMKGFAGSEGAIMGWINSDDVLLPRSLWAMARLFTEFPYIHWATGMTTVIGEEGFLAFVANSRPFTRLRCLLGDYQWIQQESTFWSRTLWDAAGGGLDRSIRLACDFELWLRFFRRARLYTLPIQVGAFRRRDGQRGVSQREAYLQEVHGLLERELRALPQAYRQEHGALLPLRAHTLTALDVEALPASAGAEDLLPLQFDLATNRFCDPNPPTSRWLAPGRPEVLAEVGEGLVAPSQQAEDGEESKALPMEQSSGCALKLDPDAVDASLHEAATSTVKPKLALWITLNHRQKEALALLMPHSRSQLAQDLFVASCGVERPIPPYFVDIGAGDGLTHNNTYLLETRLGWRGLLVEPARCWHQALEAHRSSPLDRRAVAEGAAETAPFLETQAPSEAFLHSSPGLSSLERFAVTGDWREPIRRHHTLTYSVPTLSLPELLAEQGAPEHIGYLSLDTGGAEWAILSGLKWTSHTFQIITVNCGANQQQREAIYGLLTAHGYCTLLPSLSRWEDWYVLVEPNNLR
jgi:FkbM family methyltransferase